MTSPPGSPNPKSPKPSEGEDWVAQRYSGASPQKKCLIAQRFKTMLQGVSELASVQMRPSALEVPAALEDKDPPSEVVTVSPNALEHVDLLSGPEFERFIGKAFEQKGYEVEYHGGPAEAGGDLVCWERSPERVHAILVQVKRERCFTGTKAISQIIRKENSFRHQYPQATYEKWIITSSYFSRQAKEEGKVGGITLIDRDRLADWLAAN